MASISTPLYYLFGLVFHSNTDRPLFNNLKDMAFVQLTDNGLGKTLSRLNDHIVHLVFGVLTSTSLNFFELKRNVAWGSECFYEWIGTSLTDTFQNCRKSLSRRLKAFNAAWRGWKESFINICRFGMPNKLTFKTFWHCLNIYLIIILACDLMLCLVVLIKSFPHMNRHLASVSCACR